MTFKDIAVLAAVFGGIYANLVFQDSLAAEASDGALAYEQLHQPSAAVREMEGRGRVTIYDGLPVGEIDRALDQQFDRMGALMFVRTQYPEPDGGVVYDDDCD